MRAFDRLHVKVQSPCVGVGANGCIARVCERAGLAIAETGDIVFIATKGLVFCGPA